MELAADLSTGQYRELAEFRRQIRQFLHFSEATAKEHGIEAQQHQLLLAIRGLPEETRPTIRALAAAMFIQHHSAVELINRLEKAGAVTRQPSTEDRREVWIQLTREGQKILQGLALAHRAELERSGPELARALRRVLRAGAEGKHE
jgi:DNA-binding MarR family transcriptional regulator